MAWDADDELPEPAGGISLLELALAGEPATSPPLEFQVSGQTVRVVFREVSQTRIDKLQLSAQQWAEEGRTIREKSAAKNQEWHYAEETMSRVVRNRADLLILHASLRDAAHPEREACSLNWLERRLPPDIHAYLASKYDEWRGGLSIDAVSPESIVAFRDAVKKNVDPVSLWMRFGSRTVLASAISSVFEQPETSPTAPSTPTSSGA
jgi:hypothetical protein